MFSDLSIRAKIICVAAVLLATTIGMGLLAVKNMRSINANTLDITTNWLPSIRVLGDLRAGVITYRNVVREHMLAEQTSKATGEIGQQISGIQEISRNVQQAAHGTQQVSSNITDVQRGATETGSASSQVLSAAKS
jgi:methyl-accepting chemotaxis protein